MSCLLLQGSVLETLEIALETLEIAMETVDIVLQTPNEMNKWQVVIWYEIAKAWICNFYQLFQQLCTLLLN